MCNKLYVRTCCVQQALYVDGNLGRALPQVVFAAVAVTAGLLSLLLPETLGRKLPDSLEEAANFGKYDFTPDVTGLPFSSLKPFSSVPLQRERKRTRTRALYFPRVVV